MYTLSEAFSVSSGNFIKREQRGHKSTFLRNVAVSVTRLLISGVVSLALPLYLTRRLSVETYGAWVLILQLSAYVSFLDMGVQTAVSKYVAECEAKGDYRGAGEHASAGMVLMLSASALGVLLTILLTWRVPYLFRNMPAHLHGDVRISVLLIGFSLSFALACSVFSGIFLGLQRYTPPVTIAVLNRVLFATAITIAVYFRTRLAVVGAAVAAVNVLTASLQVIAWRRMANFIPVALSYANSETVKRMLQYCVTLAIWSAGMLCVSGLDLTLVGHYDYKETAYYSIAILPTNMVVVLLSAVLGPLMPAASALSTRVTSRDMGRILTRATRYSTIILYITGLPLLMAGYFILRAWVGAEYAVHTLRYLRILVIANVLRNFLLPYATMLVGTGRQFPATGAAVVEAVVNIVSSVWLAQHVGAIGVAIGTLLGACSSVLLHFAFSLRYTQDTLSVPRTSLLREGLIRPSVMVIPSLILASITWHSERPSYDSAVWVSWIAATILLGWFVALTSEDRSVLVREFGVKFSKFNA